MKLLIKYFLLVLISIIFFACNSKNQQSVLNKNDYSIYLKDIENNNLRDINTDINFWQLKFERDTNQVSYLSKLAGLYSQRFEITGTISDLIKSEKILIKVDEKLIGENANTKRSIAKNYISQHRFKEALNYLVKAYELGENKNATNLMLFDVFMELGDFKKAEEVLNLLIDFNDFNYVIRAAKFQDYKGQLSKTIELMEKAIVIAENNNNINWKIWVYSNIADYYGHNNQIEKSYEYYLKTLQLDNHNYYSLKGIAWIAFSKERDTNKAKEILNFLKTKHNVPDLYLFQADVAQFENDRVNYKIAINKYNQLISNDDYGVMYNTYNFDLLVDNVDTIDVAFSIAQQEIKNRPTPESYDLLAWSYYKKGDFEKALEIANKYTINKSFEPTILFHNIQILKANNILDNYEEMKKELKQSVYELGPNVEKEILNL